MVWCTYYNKQWKANMKEKNVDFWDLVLGSFSWLSNLLSEKCPKSGFCPVFDVPLCSLKEYLEHSSSIYNNKRQLSMALQKLRSPPSWALLHLVYLQVLFVMEVKTLLHTPWFWSLQLPLPFSRETIHIKWCPLADARHNPPTLLDSAE